MKIATNVDRQIFGGIATSNLALFRSLEESGHTFVGIEMPRERSIKGATTFWRFHPDFFQHRIIQVPDLWERYQIGDFEDLKGIKNYWSLAITLMIELLKAEAPDVVLLNGTYIVPWILLHAAKKLKIPVVLRYAGVLTIETQNVPDEHAREMFRKLEKDFVPNVSFCIFPSMVAKRVVEEVVTGKTINRAVILPNPIFVSKTYRHYQQGQPIIAAIGRWAKVKNFPAFFIAHKQLLKEKYKHRALLITNHDRSHRVPKTVEEIPIMAQDQLQQFYSCLSVLVIPSTFETFCNVAAEALMTGTPVLVSETVGFAEVLRKFKLDDMIVPSFDDVELVAARIKKLSGRRLSFWKRRALARYLDPNRVHQQLVDVLQDNLK